MAHMAKQKSGERTRNQNLVISNTDQDVPLRHVAHLLFIMLICNLHGLVLVLVLQLGPESEQGNVSGEVER